MIQATSGSSVSGISDLPAFAAPACSLTRLAPREMAFPLEAILHRRRPSVGPQAMHVAHGAQVDPQRTPGPEDLSFSSIEEDYSDCAACVRFMDQNPDHKLTAMLTEAVTIVRICFNKYRRRAFSFNGGKDSTVVLHLARLACFIEAMHGESDPLTPHQILTAKLTLFYIHNEPQFPEMERFLLYANRKYCLGLVVYAGSSFKRCLERFCADYSPNAVLVGVRSTDPNGKMGVFSDCTPGWPQFVRVAPVSNWSYVDVWDFLLRFHFKYCKMYARGYTSIGSVQHSRPNPALRNRERDFLEIRSRSRAGKSEIASPLQAECGIMGGSEGEDEEGHNGSPRTRPHSHTHVSTHAHAGIQPRGDEGKAHTMLIHPPDGTAQHAQHPALSSSTVIPQPSAPTPAVRQPRITPRAIAPIQQRGGVDHTVFDILRTERGLTEDEILAHSVFMSGSEDNYLRNCSGLSGCDEAAATPARSGAVGGRRSGRSGRSGHSANDQGTGESSEETSHAIFLAESEMSDERGAR